MHRYFVEEFDGIYFNLVSDNHHHLKNVVKLQTGDIVVCIYNQESFEGSVISIEKEKTIVKKIKQIPNNKKPYRVTLIMGIIREQKWDFILQKASELGVDRIVPVIFNRNVVKFSIDKELNKLLRWKKICEDACEQSYKSYVPEITPIIRKIDDLKQYLSKINVCCYERGEVEGLKNIYKNENDFTFVIGPEGGFEPFEVDQMKQMGFKSIKFSESILRAETVPLYLLSTLLFNFE